MPEAWVTGGACEFSLSAVRLGQEESELRSGAVRPLFFQRSLSESEERRSK